MLWSNKKTLIVVDGRNLLFRCGDAFSDLFVEPNGNHIPTGGIYGFLSILIKIKQKYKGKIVIAWESDRGDNFRYQLFPGYKRRKITPEFKDLLEDINDQQKRLKAVLRVMGVNQYKAVGSESDDVQCRLANDWTRDGTRQAIIFSGDGDMRQCVNAYTFVLSRGRKGEVLYDVEAVQKKDGVLPRFVPDLKALAGDTSDSIPGVRGVGGVTAAKLVNAYGTVDKIIKKSKKKKKSWPVSERFREMVWNDRKNIRIYKELTTLRPGTRMNKIKPKRNQKELLKHLFYYKFNSLVDSNSLYELMNMGSE